MKVNFIKRNEQRYTPAVSHKIQYELPVVEYVFIESLPFHRQWWANIILSSQIFWAAEHILPISCKRHIFYKKQTHAAMFLLSTHHGFYQHGKYSTDPSSRSKLSTIDKQNNNRNQFMHTTKGVANVDHPCGNSLNTLHY